MTEAIRVLLVEDNPADADLTKETIEAGELQAKVNVAIDGTDALAYLLRQPPYTNAPRPHLILLDLNLPKMDGREVLTKIRNHPSLQKIPVVILTSSDAERDIVMSYELGANSFVTKPVGLQAFQSIVHSIGDFWFGVVQLP